MGQNGMTQAITPKNVVLRDNSLKPLLQCTNYKVSQKKCELLLVIVAVIHTFFWDTLYMVATAKTHPLIYSKFHMICLFYLSLPGVIADVNYQKVTLFTQSDKSFGHCKNISLNITVQ